MRTLILLCSLVWLLGGPLVAAVAPPSLADLLARAYERNPRLRALELETQAAGFRIRPAGTLPDPMVEFSLANMGLSEWMVGKDPQSGIGVSLSQTVPLSGKLRLRASAARLQAEQSRRRWQAARAELRRQVVVAYADLYYADHALAILARQQAVMRQAYQLAETIYTVGRVSQADLLKSRLEISRLEEMALPMRQMRQATEARLNLLLDDPAERALGEPPPLALAALPVGLAELQRRLEREAPQLQEATLMVDESRTMVELARRERVPDLTLRGGWTYKGGLTSMVEVMAGFEIPLFAGRRQAEMVREARAREQAAASRRSAERNDMTAMLNENFLMARSAEALLRLYREQILPQARFTVEASLSAYQAGKADIMALIGDINGRFAAELAEARQQSELWKAAAALEALTLTPLVN